MGTLEGKTAVVTGGSRGIGRAIVQRLADEGASVAFSFVANQAAADEVVAAAAGAAGVFALRADQGSVADQQRLMAEASELLGGIDILVLNAAVGPAQLFTEITEADYDQVMAVNVKGPFFAMQYAAEHLRDDGRIITISSLSTALPEAGRRPVLRQQGRAGTVHRRPGPRAGAARDHGERRFARCDRYRAPPPREPTRGRRHLHPADRHGPPRPPRRDRQRRRLPGRPDATWITGQNIRATGGLIL